MCPDIYLADVIIDIRTDDGSIVGRQQLTGTYLPNGALRLPIDMTTFEQSGDFSINVVRPDAWDDVAIVLNLILSPDETLGSGRVSLLDENDRYSYEFVSIGPRVN